MFGKKKETFIDLLKKNLFSSISIWLLPIFFWILYQYNALQYPNLAFFSYSQVINDSIVFLPITLTYFLWIIASYFFILLNKDKKVRNWLFIVFLIIISIAIVWTIWTYKTTKNNFLDLLVLIAWYFALANLLFLASFSVVYWFDNKKDLYKWLSWIKKSKSILIITSIIGIIFIWYFSKEISWSINKNLCIEHFWRVFNVKYMNDEYIFTDNLVFKNDKSVYYQNYLCEKTDGMNIKYFKLNWKCTKINWFENNEMDYFETDNGLMKNRDYDLYNSWKCIDDK